MFHLSQRLHGHRLLLLFAVWASLLLVVPGLVVPALSKIFIDYVLLKGMTEYLATVVLGLLLTAALKVALTWLQKQALLRLETALELEGNSRLLENVLHLPLRFFLERTAGEISARLASNQRVAQQLSEQMVGSLLDAVLLTCYALVMLHYSLPLTGIVVSTTLLNLLYVRLATRRRKQWKQQHARDFERLQGTSIEGLERIETIKANAAESDFFALWTSRQTLVFEAQQSIGLFSQFSFAVPELMIALNVTAVLAVGGLLIVKGWLSIGSLIAFQSLMFSFLGPVGRLTKAGANWHEMQQAVRLINEVMQLSTKSDPVPLLQEKPKKVRGEIEFRGVSFGYDLAKPPLIETFDLHIKPGSRVALVGPSGSGKTTIAKLLAGLYQPWSGAIWLDGIPRQQLPPSTLTRSLAFVDHDIILFSGTVRDNLTLWATDIPSGALIEACQDACIHDEIMLRPGGYHTHVAEGGTNFSGGQQQRLEIARALLRDPSILVIDEGTSALDAITEQEIERNLRQRGCTLLVIAHRLSTIRDCDEILVIDQGRVVQRGTHDELIQQLGPYAELIAAT